MPMTPQPPDASRKDACVLSGTVITGTKKAAFFTQLDWVKDQCAVKLGFEPYPGTMNILLKESCSQLMVEIRNSVGVNLVPPDKNFCSSQVYPVRIGKTPGAIILPEEKVNVHDANIVEILAPVFLREVLNVKDGDLVSVTLISNKGMPEN
jgi:CTP-dependent riboflavin kinase